MPVPFDNASESGGPAASASERFPRSSRILRRGDFVRVQEHGKRVHTPHFVILLLVSEPHPRFAPPLAAPQQRLGVTVGRRVGGSVQRNRVKRLVREVFRRNRELLPSDCDVVLVARPGSDRLDYASVHAELLRAQGALTRARKQLSAEAAPKPPRPSPTES